MSNHGMKRYDTNLEMSIHMEDDPRQDCKKDITEHAHEICLKNEAIKEIQSIINCTPPWLEENLPNHCNKKLELEVETSDKINLVLNKVLDFYYSSTKCPKPCKTLKYLSRYQYNEYVPNIFGLYLKFSDTVHITRSDLVLKPLTLLARIGGIIGVGKEIFWLTFFTIGLAETSWLFVKMLIHVVFTRFGV